MATTHAAQLERNPDLDRTAPTPRCSCGSTSFSVVYKVPLLVTVIEGRVAETQAARDCHEGAIVAECSECGRSDVDGEDLGCVEARELADAEAPWTATAGMLG